MSGKGMVSWCFYVCMILVLFLKASTSASPRLTEVDGKQNTETNGPVKRIDVNDDDSVNGADISLFLQKLEKQLKAIDKKNMSSTSSLSASSTTKAPSTLSHSVKLKSSDVISIIVMGSLAAGFLIILTVVVVVVIVYRRQTEKKDLSLNKELNRWDPQLLRPSKKHIDMFIFGTPIPSMAEMIKQ